MPDADLGLVIERIVDGGLSPEQLREAVARIEADPDGWRRCALAFLEAQCWGDALREPVAASSPAQAPGLRAIGGAPRRAPWRPRPALAAAVAVACFAAGWLAAGRPSRVAVMPAAPGEPFQATATPDTAPGEAPLVPPAPQARQVARLRIGEGSRDGAAPEIPIFGGPGLDPSWLLDQPMPVSAREQASLARKGYRLEQERRLVAVPLPDGRRLVVPVDRVQVRDVSSYSL